MPSQLVALATHARKASGLDALELDDLDEELPDPHKPIRVCLQLALPFELVNEFDVAKQVPHLAMMLLTAFSHIADDDEMDDGHPVTNNRPNTAPANARFIGHPKGKVISPSIVPPSPRKPVTQRFSESSLGPAANVANDAERRARWRKPAGFNDAGLLRPPVRACFYWGPAPD